MAHVNMQDEKACAWAAYWQIRAIPVLESSRSELQQMARRAERVRTADVANVVLKDPLLLLQALHSEMLSQPKRHHLPARNPPQKSVHQ